MEALCFMMGRAHECRHKHSQNAGVELATFPKRRVRLCYHLVLNWIKSLGEGTILKCGAGQLSSRASSELQCQ
jgi:hypothetical protein